MSFKRKKEKERTLINKNVNKIENSKKENVGRRKLEKKNVGEEKEKKEDGMEQIIKRERKKKERRKVKRK